MSSSTHVDSKSSAETCISQSSLSVASTQITHPPTPKRNIPAWLMISPSGSTSSASRRICRICQMDGGEMVRPCDCAGTMGDVHEECLTKWVNMSNKKECEICKSEYAKSGSRFRPLKSWAKPKCDTSFLLGILLVFTLIILIIHVLQVMKERFFYDRIFVEKMPCRSDDTGRIVLLVVLFIAIAHNIFTLGKEMKQYICKQREIRFIDKHS